VRPVALWAAVSALLASFGCGGEHYEGGGRRNELPTPATGQGPNLGPGEGTSTQGGSSGSAGAFTETEGGETGSAGAFPFGGAGGTLG
jgi:hypothetical protein